MKFNDQDSRREGARFLFILIGFFIIFLSVDGFFVYQAIKTRPGVVSSKAYEQGLHFNDIIAKAKKREHAQD